MSTANITITKNRARYNSLRIISNITTVTLHNIRLEEWVAIGIDHFTSNCITEKMIKAEHGLPKRVSHRGIIDEYKKT